MKYKKEITLAGVSLASILLSVGTGLLAHNIGSALIVAGMGIVVVSIIFHEIF